MFLKGYHVISSQFLVFIAEQKHGQVEPKKQEASLGNNTVSAAEAGTAPTDVIAPASEPPGRLKIAWCPGPASAQVILSLELQTNLREDFTITEIWRKPQLGPSPG